MEYIQIVVDAAQKLGVIGILLLIIITGARGEWVFRRHFEAERKAKDSYRIALDKALNLLEAALEKEEQQQ